MASEGSVRGRLDGIDDMWAKVSGDDLHRLVVCRHRDRFADDERSGQVQGIEGLDVPLHGFGDGAGLAADFEQAYAVEERRVPALAFQPGQRCAGFPDGCDPPTRLASFGHDDVVSVRHLVEYSGGLLVELALGDRSQAPIAGPVSDILPWDALLDQVPALADQIHPVGPEKGGRTGR